MGGMENFLTDLLFAMAKKDTGVSAIVHNHIPWQRSAVMELPIESPQAGDNPDRLKSMKVYRAATWGTALYTPVSPQFPYWLRKALYTERPDILHLHVPNPSAFWALCLPEARRIPWVVHWHADVVSSAIDRRLKLAYPLYRPFEQRLLKHACRVLTTSQAYLDSSPALKPWYQKCSAIPLGLDSSRIPTATDAYADLVHSWWGDARYRVLSVGRLTYYKGHDVLIRAIARLPNVQCLIVGDGERASVLKQLAEDLDVTGRVIFTGKLDSGALGAAMDSCDCFCLPSVERSEAFGMTLLEAMAHSKATVVCDIPGSGVSWVVKNGITGLVVEPGSPAALANALNALCNDPSKRNSMARQGYLRYRNNFSIETVSSQILKLYHSVIEIRPAEGY